MTEEEISEIEIAANGEMYIALARDGRSSYHMAYRQAAQVYWDKMRRLLGLQLLESGATRPGFNI